MKQILYLPLDERPCNADFTPMLAEGTGFRLISPPAKLLGKKKQPGDPDGLFRWLEEHSDGCCGAVLSLDALAYSSILASRLHQEELPVLQERLLRLREWKSRHPHLRLFGFSLIMRCPRYSSSDEEPDYYAECGAEIHRLGVLTHKKELGILEEDGAAELEALRTRIPPQALEDYLGRRQKNLAVNRLAIGLAAEGILDFLVIPQDDSAPYGWTARDQRELRLLIRDQEVSLRVLMYPDADAVGNTLAARMILQEIGEQPLVYVKHASSGGAQVTPLYEDRMVGESIKYQILASGGLVATSASEADILLMVNSPSGNPQEHCPGQPLPLRMEYETNRTQLEQVLYAEYALKQGKTVAFADIAYANGGDPELFSLLKQAGLLWKLGGYAGWNTSSNTLGTAIPMAMLRHCCGPRKEHLDFLALRYLEDVGYMAEVRNAVCREELEKHGWNYFEVDGTDGEAARIVRNRLEAFAERELPFPGHRIRITECRLPWNRMFEIGLKVSVISEED